MTSAKHSNKIIFRHATTYYTYYMCVNQFGYSNYSWRLYLTLYGVSIMGNHNDKMTGSAELITLILFAWIIML